MSTITPDTVETFPACPGFGFTSRPRYRDIATERDGGFETIIRKWRRPLHVYAGVPLETREESQMQEVLYFFHVHGTAITFRFRDQNDYKSCKIHETPGPTNFAPLAPLAGASPPTSWQLTKRYQFGARIQDRPITRPVGSTIAIYNAVGATQTDWTLNEATGVLTVGGAFSGEPTFWTGEFDVPCRFDGDGVDYELANWKIVSMTVQLKEKRE